MTLIFLIISILSSLRSIWFVIIIIFVDFYLCFGFQKKTDYANFKLNDADYNRSLQTNQTTSKFEMRKGGKEFSSKINGYNNSYYDVWLCSCSICWSKRRWRWPQTNQFSYCKIIINSYQFINWVLNSLGSFSLKNMWL